MENKDSDYQNEVRKIAADALLDINTERPPADNYGDCDTRTPLGKITLAVLNKVDDYVGGNAIWYAPSEYHKELVDVVSEIIQQGLSAATSVYEQPAIDAAQADFRPVDMNRPLDLFGQACVKWGMERWDGVRDAFYAAERWARRDDVTERERCHGVAQAVYQQTGTRLTLDRIGEAVRLEPGQDYAAFYETQFEIQIATRSIRAAKELFKD